MDSLRSTPDLVIEHVRPWQPGTGFLPVDAVAVVGERIVALGDSDRLRRMADRKTIVLDGRNHVLLPAFCDSHTHFQRASISRRYFVDLEEIGAASIADVLTAVRDKCSTLPAGTWLQGDNLVAQRLVERRLPDRRELDSAAPDHPVILRGLGRHLVVANSLALQIAGITRDTPEPAGGIIGRDADGEPTGALYDRGKLRLDMTSADTVIPRVDESRRLAAISEGVRALHQVGVVSIHEIVREPVELADYLRLREAGRLGIRVRFYIRSVESQTQLTHLLGLGLRTGFGDDWLRIGGLKLSIDGWEALGTAALYEPYPGQPSNTGLIRIEQEVLEHEMRLAHDHGLQIAVHAAGQRAVDLALDAYSRLLLGTDNRRRHRIEHVCLPPRPGQLERIRDLGLLLSTQPSFIEATGDLWRDMYDDERLSASVPLRTMLDLGIRVQANSDYPCSSMDPMVGIKAALARRTRQGVVLGTREAVDLPAALWMYTAAPAYSAFEEGIAGQISPGARADLITLDHDPFAMPAEELDVVKVDVTIAGGAIVFQRGESG